MGALEEVRDLAEAVARRRSLRLWDVELAGSPGRGIVRVYVDSDDGIDLDTVTDVSEEISRALDLRDPIPGRYTLEVSSPGIERALREPDHFALSLGKAVVVKTRDPLVKEGHRIEGVIAGTSGNGIRVTTSQGDIEVPYEQIKTARTVFEWK
ncbi:MAG TPA: ribosome maturation factor RimP [Actinomycetota bacterium]|nr:ribosome maturation factor RimP [Actinomycetota bacterium]